MPFSTSSKKPSYRIRPAAQSDLQSLMDLAKHATGMTNLPNDENELLKRLENSQKAFLHPHGVLDNGIYLFCLEEVHSGAVHGISGIMPNASFPKPILMFKKEAGFLVRTHVDMPESELCALFLASFCRGGGLSALLVLCRCLFIANFPSRFAPRLSANLRGVCDDDGLYPFWETFMRHYIPMSFDAVTLQYAKDKTLIERFVPNDPIPLSSLPLPAISCIGICHKQTKPAQIWLEREGFTVDKEIYITDGGPKLSCPTKSVRAIAHSMTYTVGNIASVKEGLQHLICNSTMNFRCALGSIHHLDAQQIQVEEDVAQKLEIRVGDTVRTVPAKC